MTCCPVQAAQAASCGGPPAGRVFLDVLCVVEHSSSVTLCCLCNKFMDGRVDDLNGHIDDLTDHRMIFFLSCSATDEPLEEVLACFGCDEATVAF